MLEAAADAEPENGVAVPTAAAVVLTAYGLVGDINEYGSGGGAWATACLNAAVVPWSVVVSPVKPNLLSRETDWSAFGLGMYGAGGCRLGPGDRICAYRFEMESAAAGWGRSVAEATAAK